MGIISFRRDSPDSIVYVNNIPYYIRFIPSGFVRIGKAGDHVKLAGYISGSFYKLVNNTLYRTEGQNEDIIARGVQAALHDFAGRCCVFIKNGIVHYYSDNFKSITPSDTPIVNENITKVFHATSGRNVVLQTSDNKLYLFYLGSTNEVHELPGSECYLYKQYAPSLSKYIKSKYILLTNKGLYGLKYYGHKSTATCFPIETGNRRKLTYNIDIYKLPLPDNVSPDHVRDIGTGYKYDTLFLLTNDGEVYSLGKNTYYQRGTTKKLDPHKWNQIEYPEPIKQICASQYPGLFALSENGNLYYHGYNEGSYYSFTGRKSNVSKPLKIAENVDSICAAFSAVYSPGETGDCFYYFDKQGIPRIIAGKTFFEKHFIKNHDFAYDFYQQVSKSLIHSQPLIKTVLEYTC